MLSNAGGGGGRGGRGASSTSRKRSGGGTGNLLKMFTQLRNAPTKTAAATSTAKKKATAAVTKKKLAAATVRLPSYLKKNAALQRRPTWTDYQRVFDKVDNLRIQLPLFAADRLSDQFYRLLDPVPGYDVSDPRHDAEQLLLEEHEQEELMEVVGATESLNAADFEEYGNRNNNNNDDDHDDDDDDDRRADDKEEEEAAASQADDGDNDGDEDIDDETDNERRYRDQLAYDDDEDVSPIGDAGGGGNHTNPSNDSFYAASFNEMVERYVLRAAVSPFDVNVISDAATTNTEADPTSAAQPVSSSPSLASRCLVTQGLQSYLERSRNLFGSAGFVWLRQNPNFPLQGANGAFVQPRCASIDKHKKTANGLDGGGRSGNSVGGKKRPLTNRTQALAAVHLDMCRKFLAVCATAADMTINRPFCGCCISAIRLFVYDHVKNSSSNITNNYKRRSDQQQSPDHFGSRGFDVLQFARSTQQTHVLFNVAEILYRSLPADHFAANFDICHVHKTVCQNHEQSRCAIMKTVAVQRMSFYRRIYAIHAATYALVNWLWYRQVVRHMDYCDNRMLSDVPPIILTVNKSLAQIFTRVNTLFMQLLLQKQRVFLEFV